MKQKEIEKNINEVIKQHLDFKPSPLTDECWNSMTFEEIEKNIQELYSYQLKMYKKFYEVSKVPVGELKYTPLHESDASDNILKYYATQGIQLTDPTRMFILKPSIIDAEIKSLKWYQKLWRDIYYWEGWSNIVMCILIALEGIAIGVLLYWFKYM